jgi:hypothetical protein
MTLTKFLIEQKFEKTIRILVYPNITFSKDLTKDSYVQVITNMITELNKIRKDLFFYLILPEFLEMLNFHNTKQFIIKVPTYPPTMRSHFDVEYFRKVIGHHLDIDLVFSHLPEHTHAIKNVISNVTHHSPSYFGYCHWFDLKEVVAWSQPSFNQNILGLLEMQRCYLNTQSQKNLVLTQASEVFNKGTISKLDDILVPHHLGVKESDIIEPNKNTEKLIVFNHRPDTYKDFGNFMKIIEQLRKQRQDFTIWIPLLEKSNESWITTEKFNKERYYKKLQQCRVGFSPKQVYGGWSVSTTDGIMNGCPYIMYNDDYYQELNPTADFFTKNSEAIRLLNMYLDDNAYRNKMSNTSQKYMKSNLIYKNEIKTMSDYIDDLIKRQNSVHSDVTEKLISVIKMKGQVTKQELFNSYLGWGRGIKFGPYRRALLRHKNIYDTIDSTPYYCWIDEV